MKRRTVVLGIRGIGALAAGAALLAAPGVRAQSPYPDHPIRLIVPYGPGASADQIARKFAEKFGRAIGQPVVVENKPGGSTAIGFNAVASAPADGYTMLFSSASVAVYNPVLQKNLPYKVDDLTTIALLVDVPLNLLTNTQTPINSISELAAYGKSHPGELRYSSAGIGTSTHLAGEFLKQTLGIDLVHVPYTGNAAAMVGVLRNDVQLIFDAPAPPLPQIKAGKIKALGLGSAQRQPLYAGVPPIRDAGYPDFEAGLWYGVAINRNTPAPVLQTIHGAIDTVLADPDFLREATDTWGAVPFKSMSQQQIDTHIQEQKRLWRSIVDKAGISLD
ncbi:tripartite tricarboxylate transporter substrate binding protein [Achromobacter pestifer]|uniref:Tripartite tricarboxylate transporter substrate binding protein n=1 Tax=Achromobacter pestifer TaxID=1353889 RepID=A0A7D4IAE5_9BURK|nr:tripartite tricarboxylate transporter substrate binding protein [Achromobacter pestifer]QKH37481.1 tripartite tricarboxylate transporter substrate binding protein [Achromobacter pestifer]